ncbi:DNL zinc finger-domain-containing protein [Aspergillus pseudotamarii]|uniref:DNL zinc finger-domain-containing protein n=1 Tax=Aspergillus pseudotamarii TaxID=132259 RepID=A0A5N6SME8_ASPPS|nr:DNL zinc finger-domain-containing protein [Aspergillus pseudotamarii]KAE8135878.1 DNL zinc finger-domain-containing protein [Aspergillus pseudotamarii]
MRAFTSFPRGLRAIQSSLPRTAISRPTSRPFSQLINRSTRSSPALYWASARITVPVSTFRHNSSSAKPLTDQAADAARDAENEEQNRKRREQEPAYQITFTCKPCGERSSHRMSKQGYHRGTVVIRCPSCKNRHIISDHLNIFYDKKTTLEDILAEQGNKLKRGYVEGDMEFWDDGSVTPKEGEEAKSDQGQLP